MTSWSGFLGARARASLGLLLTLLALVTVTTGILAGAVGYSGAAATTAARQALTTAVPSEAGIRVQTRQAEDPAAQDAAARSLIAQAFAPAPVAVQAAVVGEPRAVTQDGQPLEGRLVVMAGDALRAEAEDVDERVQLVDGDWPGAAGEGEPVPGLLHAATATAWGVGVGDELEVGGVPVTVSGVWRPVDPAAPVWFGDRLVASGSDEAQRGPLVVADRAAVERLAPSPFVRWTVQPDPTSIQPDDLSHLAAAAADLRESLKTPEVDVRGVTVDGDLAPTAAAAAVNLATARALGLIPLSVLALVTVLAVVQLARLLATTREPQARLLLARGASARQVLTTTLAESLLVAVLGTALGSLLAWAAMQAVPGGEGQTATVLRVAVVTGLVVLAVLAAVAVLQVRRVLAGDQTDTSGRTRAATALATVLFVLGAAGVAWWQLRRSGSPLVTREDGSQGTDLVAGAAPALLLAAAAVVALALLGPLSRLAEALTRPSRAAGGHLASAQVSRRLPVHSVPVVLTVLAVGATTLAGLYGGTSARLRDDLAAVGQGAPVRAVLSPAATPVEPGAVAPPPPTFAGLAGVERSVPVWVDEAADLGDTTFPLTMAPMADLADVVATPDVDGLSGPMVPAAELAPRGAPSEGLTIPEGTRSVDLDVTAALTVDEAALEELQVGYETMVTDMQAGFWGEEPVPADEAEGAARDLFDAMLRSAAANTEPLRWSVTLTLVDPGSGMLQQVESADVEVRRPVVLPPPTEDGAAPDYTRVDVEHGGGSGTVTVSFPETGGPYLLRDVTLTMPASSGLGGGPADIVHPAVDVTLRARTDDGTDLFGAATQGWGSTEAATPEVVAELRAEAEEAEKDGLDLKVHVDPATGDTFTEDNRVFVPAELDTSGATWTIAGRVWDNLAEELLVLPGGTWAEQSGIAGFDRAPAEDPVPGERTDVPVALTAATAEAAALSVGDRAEITAFGATLPGVVTAIVPAVPGSLAPLGGLVDRDAVAAVLALDRRSIPVPQQLWARTASGQEAAVVAALEGEDGVTEVAGPASVRITDATGAARRVFWVAAAGATLLAVTGIAAVGATLLAQRRPEVAVLRALGMPPRAQARSRALELLGVVGASVLLGLGAAWLVGRAVVPELARSTTLRGQVQLPATLQLELLPWVVLLGVGGLAVLALALALAARVRTQALDADYREEIR